MEAQHSIIIRRPVEEVFRFVTNSENAPQWKSRLVRVERLTSGTVGVGTREKHVGRFLGRTWETVVEIFDYEPDRRVAVRAIGGPIGIATFTFEPMEEGTRLTISVTGTPRRPFAWCGPLIAFLARRQMATDFALLKRLLETPA
jgi:uncharacterized protein YndB with AHSA1/START domain